MIFVDSCLSSNMRQEALRASIVCVALPQCRANGDTRSTERTAKCTRHVDQEATRGAYNKHFVFVLPFTLDYMLKGPRRLDLAIITLHSSSIALDALSLPLSIIVIINSRLPSSLLCLAYLSSPHSCHQRALSAHVQPG